MGLYDDHYDESEEVSDFLRQDAFFDLFEEEIGSRLSYDDDDFHLIDDALDEVDLRGLSSWAELAE